MAGVMKYVVQRKKTMLGDRWMVTGHNCVAQSSYLEMVTTKRRFQKTDGRQFYHFVQSFHPEEPVTPELAHQIALELAQQWKDYEVIVATHTDREHIHSHFIVNSVSSRPAGSSTLKRRT